MNKLMEIIKGKRPLIDVVHYIVGNLRYKIYYSKYRKKLLRKHIEEQITWRIEVMDRDCFFDGSCKICGCETTALQMANKSCDKPCYPKMMNKTDWKMFKKGELVRDKHGEWIRYLITGKPLLFIDNKPAECLKDYGKQ